MTNIKQLRSAIKDIVAKGIEEAQGERAQFAHLVGECQDCKWWVGNVDSIETNDRARPHVCNRSRHRYGKPLIPGSLTHGPFAAAPNFGCVQWEAKT